MSQGRVLIIEDEATLRKAVATKLISEGYDVREAKDGEEGLKGVNEFNPALVLLDIRMPRVSGMEVLEKLRNDSIHEKLPIIVFTNLPIDEALEKKFSKYNLSYYFMKTEVSLEDLTEKVKETLK